MSAPGTTPGPWYVGEERHAWRNQLVMASALHRGYVCEVQEHDGDMLANARLIAVAPDLYDALERCCKRLRSCAEVGGNSPEAIEGLMEQFEQPLARARGEA